jgi:tetraacyldisaccharide 4'-kinase
MRLEGGSLVRLSDAREVRPAQDFAGRKMHAVAGIGDPERFFGQLAGFGIQVVPHPFPDHHALRAEDLEFGDGAPVVMTEKDAVKCRRFAKPHHWVFPVRAVLDPAFGDWLLQALEKAATK